MTRNVIAVVDDLFFASKIRGTAKQIGVMVALPRTIVETVETAARDNPSLIICDLNSRRVDPLLLARELRNDARFQSIPLLGFFSHVQTELQKQAEAAGFDRVIPRSAFAKFLPEILLGTK